MPQFNTRSFTSLLLSFAFVIVFISGLVLWLSHSPQTLGIGKGAWKHAHIWASLLMSAATILHFVLNWSVYYGYLRQKATAGLTRKWELALALAITTAVVASAILLPSDDMMQRFMAMNLPQIAQMTGRSVDDIVAGLKKERINVHDPADSLREIAEHNKISPQALVGIIQPPMPGHGRGPAAH
jgi:hypothetical protein